MGGSGQSSGTETILGGVVMQSSCSYPASETRKTLGGVYLFDKGKRSFWGEFRRSTGCRGRGVCFRGIIRPSQTPNFWG